MEGLQGIQLFVPPSPIFTASLHTAASNADIMALWAAIEAVSEPSSGRPSPTLPHLDLQPSEDAQRARKANWRFKASGIGCFVLAGFVLGFLPTFWPLWLFLAGLGITLLTRTPTSRAALLRTVLNAERNWLQTLQTWQDEDNAREFFKGKDALRGCGTTWKVCRGRSNVA